MILTSYSVRSDEGDPGQGAHLKSCIIEVSSDGDS